MSIITKPVSFVKINVGVGLVKNVHSRFLLSLSVALSRFRSETSLNHNRGLRPLCCPESRMHLCCQMPLDNRLGRAIYLLLLHVFLRGLSSRLRV